jgi:hypothetical protein
MDPSRYVAFLATILDWIDRTLEVYSDQKRSVASFKFRRLPQYFSADLLNTASVVITDPLPIPPLSAMGLSEFAGFEKQHAGGITYLDTYFLLLDGAADESLHSHELVHVVQWLMLGLRTSCCSMRRVWLNGDTWTARWK